MPALTFEITDNQTIRNTPGASRMLPLRLCAPSRLCVKSIRAISEIRSSFFGCRPPGPALKWSALPFQPNFLTPQTSTTYSTR